MFTTILIFVGCIFLQIFLSKKQNRLLGLILPVLFFVFSLVATLGNVAFQSVNNEVTNIVEIAPNGDHNVIPQDEFTEYYDKQESTSVGSGFNLMVIYIFLLFNIPTTILIGIYLYCRERIKAKYQLDKMSLQDL